MNPKRAQTLNTCVYRALIPMQALEILFRCLILVILVYHQGGTRHMMCMGSNTSKHCRERGCVW